jgi:hypothetical protein
MQNGVFILEINFAHVRTFSFVENEQHTAESVLIYLIEICPFLRAMSSQNSRGNYHSSYDNGGYYYRNVNSSGQTVSTYYSTPSGAAFYKNTQDSSKSFYQPANGGDRRPLK